MKDTTSTAPRPTKPDSKADTSRATAKPSKPGKADTRLPPAKPTPDFPLFAHQTGRWCKKIRGKIHYFGKVNDPQAALDKYLAVKDDLHTGRTARPERHGLTVKYLCNHFLTAKQRRMEANELMARTFNDYFITCARIIKTFGGNRLVDDLASDDFGQLRRELAKTRGPVALGNSIQRIRTVFKHGFDANLLETPVRFGAEFAKPNRKSIRLAKRAGGTRLYSADEIKALLSKASKPMEAMILLAVNCGFGNSDCASLRKTAVDIKAGVVAFARPKTGIDRRAPLWPEAVKAITEAIAVRPAANDKANNGLAFITRFGKPWVRTRPPSRFRCKCGTTFEQPADAPTITCPECGAVQPPKKTKASQTDSVRLEFEKLHDAAGIDRAGRGFYCLRHVFRTVADEIADRPAIDRVMGHENSGDMRTAYVESIADARLLKVTDHVHAWLYGK